MSGRLLLLATLLAACSQPPPPAPRPSPTQAPAGAIPVALQGRYGLTPAACDARSDSVRGLLTIGGDGIAFGLEPLTVERVALPPGRAVFDATVPGDGVVESRRYAFTVSPDGRRLTRVETGRPDQVYTRCQDRPSGTRP